MKNEWLMIGEVLKPQGLCGEVKLRPYFADENAFLSWDTVYLKEGENYVPVSCEGARMREGFAYAVLGGASGAEEAEKLRGREVYIDRAHAAAPEEGGAFVSDLIGCRAVAPDGTELGTLTDVLQYGTVDTYVFRTPRGTMMAPALKRVFTGFDTENGVIRTDPDRLNEVAVFAD